MTTGNSVSRMHAMKRIGSWLAAGIVATGLLACQKEDPATQEALKHLSDKVDGIDKKLDLVK